MLGVSDRAGLLIGGVDEALHALIALHHFERRALALRLDRRARLRLGAVDLLLFIRRVGVVGARTRRLNCVCHGETLVHDREHLTRPDPLEFTRLRIPEPNSRARAKVSDRGRDEHLPGRGERHDPRAVDHIDAPDGTPGTLDLADVNPRSDPYPELRIRAGDRSHAMDRAGRTLERRKDSVSR